EIPQGMEVKVYQSTPTTIHLAVPAAAAAAAELSDAELEQVAGGKSSNPFAPPAGLPPPGQFVTGIEQGPRAVGGAPNTGVITVGNAISKGVDAVGSAVSSIFHGW